MNNTNPDIWNDPLVKERLREGVRSDDIAILPCPKCATLSYYNQGSHFTCRNCNSMFDVLVDGESASPGQQVVWTETMRMLCDCVEEDGP